MGRLQSKKVSLIILKRGWFGIVNYGKLGLVLGSLDHGYEPSDLKVGDFLAM
jgi:hypothetical protein